MTMMQRSFHSVAVAGVRPPPAIRGPNAATVIDVRSKTKERASEEPMVPKREMMSEREMTEMSEMAHSRMSHSHVSPSHPMPPSMCRGTQGRACRDRRRSGQRYRQGTHHDFFSCEQQLDHCGLRVATSTSAMISCLPRDVTSAPNILQITNATVSDRYVSLRAWRLC